MFKFSCVIEFRLLICWLCTVDFVSVIFISHLLCISLLYCGIVNIVSKQLINCYWTDLCTLKSFYVLRLITIKHYLHFVFSLTYSWPCRLSISLSQRDRYRLRVRASDRGYPPSHADVDIELDVVDRNNKPPLWDRDTLSPIHIKENVTVGTVVTSVKARFVWDKGWWDVNIGFVANAYL